MVPPGADVTRPLKPLLPYRGDLPACSAALVPSSSGCQKTARAPPPLHHHHHHHPFLEWKNTQCWFGGTTLPGLFLCWRGAARDAQKTDDHQLFFPPSSPTPPLFPLPPSQPPVELSGLANFSPLKLYFPTRKRQRSVLHEKSERDVSQPYYIRLR